MRLSLQTDYALRTLMYLATMRERSTAADVARLFCISGHHVAKVVQQLARQGFVRSTRGSGGGIELARPAENIRVGEVIAAFEGNMHLLECIGTQGVCVIESFCKLKRVLADAEDLQMDYLNGITLADVLPAHRQLHKIPASPSLR